MDDRTPEAPLTAAELGVPSSSTPATPKTHEQKVESRLAIIAWSVAVTAILSVLSTIGSLVALGAVASH